MYHLAVNIHSFSECPQAAIRWWLQQLQTRRVPWLLIVPNHPEQLLSAEADGSTRDFRPDVEAAGYHLAIKRPVYANAEVRELVGVNDHYFLFHRHD